MSGDNRDVSFKSVEECDEVATSMGELLKSRGWKYFDAAMLKAESLITLALPNMPVAFDRDKALGELVQIRKARAFPATMANTALSTRERLQKQKEKANGRR